jgi:predicted PurR-regulated permease PerM
VSEPTSDEDLDAAPARTVGFTLTFRALVFTTLAIVVAIAFLAVVTNSERVLVWIGVGLLLGLALDPLVRSIQRRGRSRRVAAVIIGGSLVLLTLLVIVLVGPATVEQAGDFQEQLPETIQGFYDLPVVGDWLEKRDAAQKAQDFVDELPATIDDDTVEGAANSLVGGALSLVFVVAIAFAVMLDGERLVARVRWLIPERHHQTADRLGRTLYQTFGNYFGGSLTVAVMSGAYVLTIALIFGVPLAPVAGIWAMVTNPIPQIGGFLGGSFVTVLALSVSVPTAIAVGVLFVVYMNFENNVIQPAVIGEAVDLSPPTTMLAALIGGAAAGVPGALVATPLIGTIKRLYLEFRGHTPDEADTAPSLGDRIRAGLVKLKRRSAPST